MVKFMWLGALELRLSPSDKTPVKPVLKVPPPHLINLNNLKLFFPLIIYQVQNLLLDIMDTK